MSVAAYIARSRELHFARMEQPEQGFEVVSKARKRLLIALNVEILRQQHGGKEHSC